jgi:hypothetical protein
MSQQAPPPSNDSIDSKILGNFASLLGVLAVFLYFTGWIYRWSYFGFFQIEVTNLEFPVESFFIVPFQVVFGNIWTLLISLLAFVSAVCAIHLTLKLLHRLSLPSSSNNRLSRLQQRVAQVRQVLSKAFPPAIRNEIVIVVWVLMVLFWLARYQGTVDARRDAVNDTSTLPVVALVFKEDDLALGRKLDNQTDSPLEKFRIIGDKGLFDQMPANITNDASTDNPVIWRLLIRHNGWIYLFKVIPANASFNMRPYVLVVQEGDGGNKLLILSPKPSQSNH